VALLLDATRSRLEARNVSLDISEAAIDWIAEHGYEPEYGARPLRRVIQRELDDRIAELLVASAVLDGGAVSVDVIDGRLSVVSAAAELPLAA
jgi:ATP-dependent Clp protease ATP-binding subunit ClpC